MSSRTLVILKPEALENGIVGRVLQYFDDARLQSVAMKQYRAQRSEMEQHYAEVIARVGPEIGESIVSRMTRGDCIFIIYEGIHEDMDIINIARTLIGATDPAKADGGTIRKAFGTSVQYNVVHASDSIDSAEREIAIWFPELLSNKQ